VDASYLEVYNEQIADLLCQPIVEEDFVPLKPKERILLEEKLKKLLKVLLIVIILLVLLLDYQRLQIQYLFI
jgi:hypothetical protein